jgi:hypothetical protein
MASNPQISAPASVPAGSLVTVVVTFTLDPGSPDSNGYLCLRDANGTLLVSQSVTLLGTPAESFPAVEVGAAPPGGYGLTLEDTTVGTLTKIASGSFPLLNG